MSGKSYLRTRALEPQHFVEIIPCRLRDTGLKQFRLLDRGEPFIVGDEFLERKTLAGRFDVLTCEHEHLSMFNVDDDIPRRPVAGDEGMQGVVMRNLN